MFQSERIKSNENSKGLQRRGGPSFQIETKRKSTTKWFGCQSVNEREQSMPRCQRVRQATPAPHQYGCSSKPYVKP